MTPRRIAVSTGGGDAPGLNAVIRAIVLSALNRGWECVGIRDGYNGLLSPGDHPQGGLMPLDRNAVRGLTHLGGTILGTTNRGNPLRFPVPGKDGKVEERDRSDELVALFRRRGLDALVAICGDGSLEIADALSPAHPNASVAIVDADAWSETVEEGARFRLVSREGNLPLTLSEVSQVPHGCDGNETTMAAFRTPHDLAEQLVWILPEGPEGHETAAVVPVTAGAKGKRQRDWTVGPLAIRVRLDGAHAGRMEVRTGQEALLVHPFEKPEMQGADMAALDLTGVSRSACPIRRRRYRISGALTIVVLRTVTYEGVSFEALALRDTLARAGTQYVYLCAF